MAPPPATLPLESITDEDVMLFKASLLVRRYPGLRNLSDADIRSLIAADPGARQRRLEDPRLHRTHPKTQYAPGSKRQPTAPVPPFMPVAPFAAREDVARPWQERCQSYTTPYDSDRVAFLADMHNDKDKQSAAPWSPISPRKAATTIQNDYFMYSPLATQKDAERSFITARGTANRQQFAALTQARRGKMLV